MHAMPKKLIFRSVRFHHELIYRVEYRAKLVFRRLRADGAHGFANEYDFQLLSLPLHRFKRLYENSFVKINRKTRSNKLTLTK